MRKIADKLSEDGINVSYMTVGKITGLKVICVRDESEYKLTKKVSDEEFESINVAGIAPFGTWNDLILPH
ncbi:MAG: hypothetical protein LBD93_00920 [Treponema sp.]|nr:hypothetical protein [Treponema sp.]